MSSPAGATEMIEVDERLLFDPHTTLALRAHYFRRLTVIDATMARAGGLIAQTEPPQNGAGGVFRFTNKGRALTELSEGERTRETMLVVTSMLVTNSSEYLRAVDNPHDVFWHHDATDPVSESLNEALGSAIEFWNQKKARRRSRAAR
ncbi:hypothetical protein [Roseivivax sp. CAU 1761]